LLRFCCAATKVPFVFPQKTAIPGGFFAFLAALLLRVVSEAYNVAR